MVIIIVLFNYCFWVELLANKIFTVILIRTLFHVVEKKICVYIYIKDTFPLSFRSTPLEPICCIASTGWRRVPRAWWCEEWRHGASKARGWQSRSEADTAGTGRDAPNPADAPVHWILRKMMLQFGGSVRGVLALVPLILVALAAASSDLFDNQLGDINYCKKQCQMSIKNKSPAKVSATYQMLLQYIL